MFVFCQTVSSIEVGGTFVFCQSVFSIEVVGHSSGESREEGYMYLKAKLKRICELFDGERKFFVRLEVSYRILGKGSEDLFLLHTFWQRRHLGLGERELKGAHQDKGYPEPKASPDFR